MRKKYSGSRWIAAMMISFALLAGYGCGGSDPVETTREMVETTTEEISEVETTVEETTVEEITEAVEIVAKELDVIYAELNDSSFGVNEDVREYIEISDEALYDAFAVSHNVDITTCGEYQIKVSDGAQEFLFPVEVRDTIYPTIEITADFILGKEKDELTKDLLITKYEDNDPEYRYGFVGFEKVMELKDLEFSYMDTTVPVYEQENMDFNTELIETIVYPGEEGVYESKAVVVDRSGNAATAKMYFVVDNTGPVISIAKEHVSLKAGEGYDFGTGLDCKDNFFPKEECGVWVDEHSFNALVYFLGSGLGGETTLKYVAEDGVGNLTEKVIKVTAECALAPEPSGGSGNDSSPSSPSQSEGFFDEGLAREAFDKVNEYRIQNGVPALAWNDGLYEAAKIRAKELVASFSHTRPNGEGFDTVLSEIGLPTDRAVGENAAMVASSGSEVAEAWYNSSGHRENMLRDKFNSMAVACWRQNGNFYWINLFLE